MKTRLLIFAIALLLPMQLVYAQPIPEPEPVCKEGTILTNGACVSADGSICGPGTTYQDGICVVDKIENSTESSSGKWDGYQLIQDIESEDLGGGSIDLDPDLSPSYVNDFVFSWKSIFVFVPLVSGIIATTLLSIHFILKKKNIRSRPYITIISAAIMLYFGTQTLSMLGTIVMFLQQESPWHYLDQIVALLAYPIIGFSLTGLGIFFLYKSQLIRSLIRK